MVMWWRRRSLRARLTLATSAGLALALALAAVLLVSALHASLVRDLDVSARQGAVEVAALIEQNRLPSPVPVAPGTLTIQVLDATGRITNISPGADRLVPMLLPAQARAAARTGQARTLAGPPLGLPSMLRVVAVGAAGHHVVISAISYTQASDSLATLARVLAIGTPLLFALLALVTWLLTGYTLRPIAALRRGAGQADGEPAGQRGQARGQPGLRVGAERRRVGGAHRDRRRPGNRVRRCRTGLRSLRSARRRTQPVRGRRRRAGPGHREVDRGGPRGLGGAG